MVVRRSVATLPGNDTMMVPEPWLLDLLWGLSRLGCSAIDKPVTFWILFAIRVDNSLELVIPMEEGRLWTSYLVHLLLVEMLLT